MIMHAHGWLMCAVHGYVLHELGIILRFSKITYVCKTCTIYIPHLLLVVSIEYMIKVLRHVPVSNTAVLREKGP